jgi:hypothetical protein
MKYTIKFEEGSLANFNKIIEHYEKISGELADRFHNDFWNKIDYIKENPLHHQLGYKIVRIAHLKVFPFAIHFILDGTVIKVFKILHHKQYYK